MPPRRDVPALLECVPNISEGRDAALIRAAADAAAAVPGVRLLDVHSDEDHHRSVVTLAGEAAPLRDAVLAIADVVVPGIDLTRHGGVHPRTGALDVVPFVPLGDTPMKDAVEAARATAHALAERHDLPVYLYAHAAREGRSANLHDVRKGGFEALRDSLGIDASRAPDFGPERVHPTAGATIVGARPVLIAFNVEFAPDGFEAARGIARSIRATTPGGLPAVRALAFTLSRRSISQVSMNLEDWRTTGIAEAYRRVADEAARRSVRVLGAELVGLAPGAAVDDAVGPPGVPGIRRDQAIEFRLDAGAPRWTPSKPP